MSSLHDVTQELLANYLRECGSQSEQRASDEEDDDEVDYSAHPRSLVNVWWTVEVIAIFGEGYMERIAALV